MCVGTIYIIKESSYAIYMYASLLFTELNKHLRFNKNIIHK